MKGTRAVGSPNLGKGPEEDRSSGSPGLGDPESESPGRV